MNKEQQLIKEAQENTISTKCKGCLTTAVHSHDPKPTPHVGMIIEAESVDGTKDKFVIVHIRRHDSKKGDENWGEGTDGGEAGVYVVYIPKDDEKYWHGDLVVERIHFEYPRSEMGDYVSWKELATLETNNKGDV